MSRPQLARPTTSEGLSDRTRTTNFSRPIAPVRSQSISHDLLTPPNFDLTAAPPKAPEQKQEPKYRYVPHIRISDDDGERPNYRPHLRLEDDDEEEEDQVEDRVEDLIGTAETSDGSYETNPPTSSTENTTSTELSNPLTPSKPITHLGPSRSRPAAFAYDSFTSISSTSSAAPKPLRIRPPTSKYARATEPSLETIPSVSPPDRNSLISPPHDPSVDSDAAPSPGIPSRRHARNASLEVGGGHDSDPDSAAAPSIPSRRPRIIKRVSLDQHSEHDKTPLPTSSTQTHFAMTPIDDDSGSDYFGVKSKVSHAATDDLEFEQGAFPDPFDAASRVSIDSEALEPYDAPELPPTANLPYRESNSSSRGSAHRSSSETSSWSGGSWTGGRHPVEGLSEKEIRKLKKKGINPELFAEMREARRAAHGKRARLIGPLVGGTFVG